MTVIEQLVEALKYHTAQTRPIQQTIEAIAAGEAELRREPVAWMDKHGNIERGWDAILNPNEFTPLYTRGKA
jgi:hypothetical protein